MNRNHVISTQNIPKEKYSEGKIGLATSADLSVKLGFFNHIHPVTGTGTMDMRNTLKYTVYLSIYPFRSNFGMRHARMLSMNAFSWDEKYLVPFSKVW